MTTIKTTHRTLNIPYPPPSYRSCRRRLVHAGRLVCTELDRSGRAVQHHRLARCDGGSDPCAGGALILLHKRTAGAEALPIWTSADPDFFSAPEAPWVSLRVLGRCVRNRVSLSCGQRRHRVRISSGAGPMLLGRCVSGLTLSRYVTSSVCVADLRLRF